MNKHGIQKVYLGDSVYAEFDGYGVVLTTENGHHDDPRNRIVMEPEVLAALESYTQCIRGHFEALAAEQGQP